MYRVVKMYYLMYHDIYTLGVYTFKYKQSSLPRRISEVWYKNKFFWIHIDGSAVAFNVPLQELAGSGAWKRKFDKIHANININFSDLLIRHFNYLESEVPYRWFSIWYSLKCKKISSTSWQVIFPLQLALVYTYQRPSTSSISKNECKNYQHFHVKLSNKIRKLILNVKNTCFAFKW